MVTTAGLGCPWCSAPLCPDPVGAHGCADLCIIRAGSVQEADSAWLLCTAGTSLHFFVVEKGVVNNGNCSILWVLSQHCFLLRNGPEVDEPKCVAVKA